MLGNQLDEQGRVVPWFKDRLMTGLALLRKSPNSVMVITGGQTRAGFPSEAEEGRRYLLAYALGHTQAEATIGTRIFTETEARSTSDHPGLVKAVLEGLAIEGVAFVFVTSEHRVPRARQLFRKYWPESQENATWIGIPGHSTKKDWVLEVVFSLIDQCPPLANWLKRRYRNDTR